MTHQTVGAFDPPKAGCKPTLRGGGRIATIKVGESQVPAAQLVELIALVEAKSISNSTAQPVFAEMFETGKAPAAIVQEKGLAQVSDIGAIEKIADEVIAANPGPGVAGEIQEKKLKA